MAILFPFYGSLKRWKAFRYLNTVLMDKTSWLCRNVSPFLFCMCINSITGTWIAFFSRLILTQIHIIRLLNKLWTTKKGRPIRYFIVSQLTYFIHWLHGQMTWKDKVYSIEMHLHKMIISHTILSVSQI